MGHFPGHLAHQGIFFLGRSKFHGIFPLSFAVAAVGDVPDSGQHHFFSVKFKHGRRYFNGKNVLILLFVQGFNSSLA